MRRPSAYHRALWLLLAVSVLLRLALAVRGGQRFFPDENRYLRCFILLRHLEGGRPGAALDYLLTNPDHTGFILVGAAPALAQQALLRAFGQAADRASIDVTAWLPALLLSLLSVASIALVAALARRLGATEAEALAAAGLMSGSTTMLVYSRHLLPYDASLALLLWSLWIGLRDRPSPARSSCVGLLAGAAVLTYNGYWLGAAAVLALHVLVGSRSLSESVRRGLLAALGAAALPVALSALGSFRGLGFYARKMARFSRLASTDADLSEGWSLPWAYLWHAEHGLLLAFAAACVAVPLGWPQREGARRARVWLGAALGLYAAMVVMSNGFERVGTFGRQTRQMVPFLCLTTAAVLASFASRLRPRRWVWPACGLALLAQAAFNFAWPLQQRFPRDVVREVLARYGAVARAASVVAAPSPEDKVAPDARHVLLNARYLHSVTGALRPPGGRVVFRAPHPQQYLPYQYEGLVPLERELLRSTDVSIRLIETRAP